jgi:hypothetical protein
MLLGKEIADSLFCDDINRTAGIFLNFLTQPSYMYLQAVRGAWVIVTPDSLGNAGMTDDPSGVSHQMAENTGLGNGKIYFRFVFIKLAGSCVQLQVPAGYSFFLGLPLSSDLCFNTCQ